MDVLKTSCKEVRKKKGSQKDFRCIENIVDGDTSTVFEVSVGEGLVEKDKVSPFLTKEVFL